VSIVVNLLPEFDKLRLLKELHFRKDLYQNAPVSSLLKGLLNQKLAEEIIHNLHLKKDMNCGQLEAHQLEHMLQCLTAYQVDVTGYRDYEFAQVCTGGIPVSDIHWDTLESKLVPQIHFAGELIDVDGICGGYNLHFAWATGYMAGKAVGK
jgi:predicted Rossmann fold flavoprotein